MAEDRQKDRRELCNAAIAARDPNDLLRIIQELHARVRTRRGSAATSPCRRIL